MFNDFEQFSFAANQLTHTVYCSRNRGDPPILVMPEIAGMSPGLSLFIQRLVKSHFRVYVPLLFGPLGRRAPARNAIRLCISREFANLRTGVSAPITVWLRALAGHMSELNDGVQVGAIGMCLTGAFAIPLVLNPRVRAAVAAQPSVPLSALFVATGRGGGTQLSALNISAEDIADARARLGSGQAHLLALRCRADRICPHEKIERLQKEFPAGLVVREYGEDGDRNSLGERPHATFTKEHRLFPDAPPEHHSQQAFADLVAFFDQHLRGSKRTDIVAEPLDR
jgi:dienelactone hydrolase